MKKVALLVLLLVGTALAKVAEQRPEENEVEEQEAEAAAGGYETQLNDPCRGHHCALGRECDLTEDNTPICVCARECLDEDNDRARVCSKTNVTFESECELHRQRCLCHKGQDGCKNREYEYSEMDYFGPCIEITECTETEMKAFPERMRDWLLRVMETLADRKALNAPAEKMAKETLKRPKRWVLPVIWKFCDLDMSHDLTVDTEEMQPMTAPLKGMEHCWEPFREQCDANGDGKISFDEWKECLGLDDEDVGDDLLEQCADLQ